MSWKDARQRQEEVKAAFMEGHSGGMNMRDPEEAWSGSRARYNLASPLPPEQCRCGSREWKRARSDAIGLICARCLRPAWEPEPPIARAEPKLERGQAHIGDAIRGLEFPGGSPADAQAD